MSYLDGCDILGADVTIPTEGAVYNDSATVFSVQTALKAKGFNPARSMVSTGRTRRRPSKPCRRRPGCRRRAWWIRRVDGAWRDGAPVSSSAPSRIATSRTSYVPTAFNGSYAQIIPQAGAAVSPTDGLLPAPPSFWSKPLWEGSPIKVGQAISEALPVSRSRSVSSWRCVNEP